MPFMVEIRPATGEEVVLRVEGGDGIHLRASAAGFRLQGKRLAEFVAPGTLEITGGEGELELHSADPRAGFILSFKREAGGVSREFEARGQRATIRVRGGEVTVEAETMIMREPRAP